LANTNLKEVGELMTQVSQSRLFHLSVAEGKNEYLNWLV